MAIQSTPEEVFRFSIVRNPKPAAADALAAGVVRTVGVADEKTHPGYAALLRLIAGGADRAKITSFASKEVRKPGFLKRVQELRTPLWQLSDRLAALDRPTINDVVAAVEDVFAAKPSDIVKDKGFVGDRAAVADAFIVAAVANPPISGLRTRLMQALRTAEVVRILAAGHGAADDRAIGRALRATVLLPRTIFPLPASAAETDRNRAEHAKQKKAAEDRRAGTQKKVDQIAANVAAIEELSANLSSHLLDGLTADKGAPKVTATTSVLPRATVKGLSVETRAVVAKELRLAEDRVDVPNAVAFLEHRNLLLGQALGNLGDILVKGDLTSFAGCGECKPTVLPAPKAANDFSPATRGEVEVVGIQDLLMVRQRLAQYRGGEVAHIENVLKGERKAKTHRKLDRTETTVLSETERDENVEVELQTTDKYELQTASSRVIQEDKKAEAGVTVTASYGPVEVEAHGSYASSTSTTESRQSASTYARDVVNRSVHSIRERVLNRRSRTDLTELEITNEHEFDNKGGTAPVVGVYRWVDKFYEAQIVNYGKRTMLEFMVPDPAAFYRYAEAAPVSTTRRARPERPGFCRNDKFLPLRPSDVRADNYMCFVGNYNVSDVNPPAPRFVRVSDLLKFKVDTTDEKPITFAEVNDSFKIPQGYAPRTVSYTISGGNSHSAVTKGDDHDDIIHAMVTIGSKAVYRYYKNEIGETPGGEDYWPDLTQVIEWGRPLSSVEKELGSYATGLLSGSFPLDPSIADDQAVKISLVGHTTLPMSVAIHYTVLCERTQATYERWQIDTFNSIEQAYLALLREYETSLEEDAPVMLSTIEGRNPLINRDIERRELKKFAISLLTGQQYDSFNAMESHYATSFPQINLEDAGAEGSFVRFFEQALEWKHMTYLFYPYFWASKSGWASVVHKTDVDPLFQQFLQAGFARVWVPIRPGFDLVVLNYIQAGGEPWTEKDAPLIDEPAGGSPAVISIIDEIKEQLGADFEFRPGKIKVRKDTTEVEGAGTDFRDYDTDREILIALQYYRIAGVNVTNQTLTLAERYRGDDADAIGFAIGVKFVGEPWLVQVPTTLVHLAPDDGMIVG